MIPCMEVCVAPSFLPPTAPNLQQNSTQLLVVFVALLKRRGGHVMTDCSVFYLENLFSFSSLNPEMELV